MCIRSILAIVGLVSSQGAWGAVSIIGTWGGHELDNFLESVKGSGVEVKFETTRDLDAVLMSRVEAGNPPDLAILPNPGKLRELAKQQKLVELDFLPQDSLSKNFASHWRRLGSYGGKHYGLFIKATNKSLVWYNPEALAKEKVKPPTNWDEVISTAESMAKNKKRAWAIGADLGWPLTDWVENIFVHLHGADEYEKWVNHETPWNDPKVQQAFEAWGRLVAKPEHLAGGRDGTLAATFQNAAFLLFKPKPEAFFYMEGDFIAEIVRKQFSKLQPGKNLDFAAFPVMNPSVGNMVVGGADSVVVLKRNREVEKLVAHLASPAAHEAWAKKGGYISPSNAVPLDAYPDALTRKAAEYLVQGKGFVFDASDLMPSRVGNQGGFWDACKKYVQNPEGLKTILAEMERLAQQSY